MTSCTTFWKFSAPTEAHEPHEAFGVRCISPLFGRPLAHERKAPGYGALQTLRELGRGITGRAGG